MKRDLDYIRKLLFEIEANEQPWFAIPISHSSNSEDDKKLYHARLLCDAGYLTCVGESGIEFRITNQGHDYLDAIRDDTIWSKTKKKLEPAGSVSLEIVKQVATGFVVDLIT